MTKVGRLLFCSKCGNANSDFIHELCTCETPDFSFGSHEEYTWYAKNPNVQFLTTGQMIDALKMGEIAEGVSGFLGESRLKRTSHDEIVYMEPSSGFFSITTFAANAKWVIYKNESLPENICANCQFIDFGECHATDEDIDYHEDVLGVTACNCFKSIEAIEVVSE